MNLHPSNSIGFLDESEKQVNSKPNLLNLIDRRRLLAQLGATLGIQAISPKSSLLQPENPASPDAPLRLDRNENAYGASRASVAAVKDGVQSVSHFPANSDAFVSSLAKAHGVHSDQILLGAGTSEILRMAALACLGPKRKLVMATPSYDVIARYAKACNAEVSAVPLTKAYAHDLDAMLASVDSQTGLVYICNPNNPTGTLTDWHALELFVKAVPESAMVVIDEAYHDYAGGSKAYGSALTRHLHRVNLVVTRTFSKAYGLAGLRLGYAVGNNMTLKRFAAEKVELGINNLALLAGAAALADSSHVGESARQNQDDRQEFINQVNARMLRVLDSHGNFACLNVMRPAKEIIEHYRKNNIILSDEIPLMPNYVRVSFGRPEAMTEFWRVWDLLKNHPMAM